MSRTVLLACGPDHVGLASALTGAGHRVILKRTGPDALGWLRENTPDLLMLDVELEGAGGIDICYRTKKVSRLKEVPVALLFGSGATARHRIEAQMAKADALLSLPMARDAFREAVTDLLPELARSA